MQKLKLLSLMPLLLAAIVSQPQQANADRITPGNIVVTRVGTGTAALANSATATFLDEYTTGGVLVQSIALPPTATSSGSAALTLSGTASSEGALDLSNDGRYLTLAGYNADPGTQGGTAVGGTSSGGTSINNSASSTINRVVARVEVATGNVDTTTRISDGYNQNNIRGATSANGSTFYTAGNGPANGAGTRLETLGGTTSTAINTVPNTTRTTNIFNNQLFISSNSTAGGTFTGVSRIGTGIPTTSGQTATLIANSPNAYAFLFTDANTLYVADETNGLSKFVSTDGFQTAVSAASYTSGTGTGIRGLTFGGTDVNGNNIFYGTTLPMATNDQNRIVSITDMNGSFSGLTTIATAGTNQAFRGLAVQPVPEPTTIAMLLMGLSGIGGAKLKKRKKRATI